MEAQKTQKTTTPPPCEQESSKNGHDRSDSYTPIIPKLPEVPTELLLRGLRRNATAHDTLGHTPWYLSPEHAQSKPDKAAKDRQVDASSYAPWVHEALGILNQAKQDDVKHQEAFRQLQDTIAAFGTFTSPLNSEVRRVEAMIRKHAADVEGCLKVDRAIEEAFYG